MGSDNEKTPLFAELVKKRGYDPFDLSAEIAQEIKLASKAVVEIFQGNIHRIPRSDT